MQSELSALEERLVGLDNWAEGFGGGLGLGAGRGMGGGNDIWALPRSWRVMKQAGEKAMDRGQGQGQGASEGIKNGGGSTTATLTSAEERASEMWRITLRIRELLDEYNKALTHQSFLHTLQKPSTLSQKAVHNILFDAEGKPTLISPSEAEYVSKFAEDLITLAPGGGQEVLTRFLERRFGWVFETKADKKRASPDSPLTFFSESRINSTVRGIAVVLSSVLPILSVVVLYFIANNNIRLGLIVLFTVICSASLAFLSKASNSEIIVATATYAAVQVVFVSGNLSASS